MKEKRIGREGEEGKGKNEIKLKNGRDGKEINFI